MRNKIKVIATSMLSIALLIISCIATTLLVNAEGNSTVQKGAVAMVDTSTGPTWEGKYGKDGYIIFEGTSGSGSNWTTNVSFYSDLYPNHTGTEIIKGVDVQGRPGGASSYTFLTNEDKNNKNYGMKTDSPISRWGYGTVAWWKNMTDDLAKKSTLCVPGNPEQYTYGTFGRNANTLPNDISIFFTLEAEEKTYVTVYVSDMWDKVSDDKRIKVLLYPTNKVATNSKAEDLDAFYGATPIEQTSLSSNGYITFELEGAGDYQIVVADEKNNTETKPSIQGIFFDSKLLRNARHLKTDATTGTSAWQDKYGKDGYVVFNGAGTSSSGTDWRKNVSFYSNLYPDDNGLSVINAYNTNDRNNGKANYTFLTQEDQTNNNYGMSEDSPISRWGYATTVWWGNMTEEFAESHTLRIPGSEPAAYTKGTFGKTVKNNHIKNDLSVLFTLKGNEKINVTVFVSGLQNYEISELNKAEVLVYPTAQLKMSETQKVGEINGTADLNAFYGTQPLAKATITSNCYITFELEGAGDYQIVVADDNTDETVKAACAPSIQGVFFDTIEYYSVTYRNIESGVINDNPDNYAEIETITLKDPIKEGYIFEGWYTTETFDEDTKVTRITKEYGNVTLYAKFVGAATVTIDGISQTVGTEGSYILPEYTKENGKGWIIDGKIYKAGASVELPVGGTIDITSFTFTASVAENLSVYIRETDDEKSGITFRVNIAFGGAKTLPANLSITASVKNEKYTQEVPFSFAEKNIMKDENGVYYVLARIVNVTDYRADELTFTANVGIVYEGDEEQSMLISSTKGGVKIKEIAEKIKNMQEYENMAECYKKIINGWCAE